MDERNRVDTSISVVASGDRGAVEQIYRIMQTDLMAIAFSVEGGYVVSAQTLQNLV